MTAILERWTAYVWLAVLVATPLAFNPWSRRVFEPEKAAALRVLAVVLMGLWVLGLVRGERRRNLVGVALPTCALAGLYTASTAFSLAPRASIFGSYEWRQGALTFFACLLLFLTATDGRLVRVCLPALLNVIEGTSFLVAGYGLLQYAGLDPVPWHRAVEGRAFATLGHPNFLAAYLLLAIPPIAARMASSSSPRGRLIHGTALLAELVCLVVTYSRSAWLGLLASALCFGWLLQQVGPRRLRLAAAVCGAAIVLFLALAYLDPGGLFSDSPLEPVHSVLRGKSATAGVRLLTWHGSIDAVRARPWLGYGPETFRLSFPRAYPEGLAAYGGVLAAGEHAHNEWLDWALNVGILGLLAYVWLLVAVFRRGVRAVRARTAGTPIILAGLVAAGVGYLVQNQLSFGTVAPLAYFWLYLGLIVALTSDGDEIAVPTSAPAAFSRHRGAASWGIAAYTAIALLAVGALELRALAADVYARRAEDAALVGDAGRASADFSRAVLLDPVQPRFWQDLGESWAAAAVAEPGRRDVRFADAERALQRAVDLSPLDAQYRTSLARLYYQWGAAGSPEKLRSASDAYGKAVELSARDPDIWRQWGRAYHALRDYPGALEKYQIALSYDRLNTLSLTYLAEAYLALGQFPQARDAYDRAEAAAAEVDRRVSKR